MYDNVRQKECVLNSDVLHVDITRIMRELCFTQNYSGYKYVREAIKLAVMLNGRNCGISKDIYPDIAKKMGTTATAVESGMRTAIRRAWLHTDDRVKLELFGTFALEKGWVPSNSEFVFMLADRLLCSAIYGDDFE